MWRPYVAPPIFRAAFVVFCLPFVFPQREGKMYELMKELLVLKCSQCTDMCYDIRFKHYSAHDNFH